MGVEITHSTLFEYTPCQYSRAQALWSSRNRFGGFGFSSVQRQKWQQRWRQPHWRSEFQQGKIKWLKEAPKKGYDLILRFFSGGRARYQPTNSTARNETQQTKESGGWIRSDPDNNTEASEWTNFGMAKQEKLDPQMHSTATFPLALAPEVSPRLAHHLQLHNRWKFRQTR